MIEAMRADSGIELNSLKVDGGASANNFIMQAQADQRWEEKKQMEEIVSDISHQVKTPIANLRMYHELAAQEPEKAGEFMEAEERQIDKLEFLMKTMIKMSRLETGLIEVKPLKNKVYDLIFQAVCTIALKAEKKEIDIEVECSENLEALFDRKWTVEALANILDNAVKYSGKGSRIRIRADRTDYFVRIRVEDEGRGIREDNLPNIFKRFYREKESNDVEGVGIGLYLTRQIIMQEKGFVEALSRQGIGAVFSLHLPADVPETFEG